MAGSLQVSLFHAFHKSRSGKFVFGRPRLRRSVYRASWQLSSYRERVHNRIGTGKLACRLGRRKRTAGDRMCGRQRRRTNCPLEWRGPCG